MMQAASKLPDLLAARRPSRLVCGAGLHETIDSGMISANTTAMLQSRPAVRRVIRIRGAKVPAPARKTFGKAFREARPSAEMTQAAAARSTGIDRSYISDLERGLANPSLDTMNALAEGVGMELEVLLTLPSSPLVKNR